MSGDRIKQERFAQGRKRVIDLSIHYADRTGLVASDPVIQANLKVIRDCLKNGDLIPIKFYRNGIDRDTDYLLQNHGIKHLHLHEDTSVDCLLFLVEYRDSVLFLEIDGHSQHFSKPAGSLLAQLHQSEIVNADAKAAAVKAAKLAASKAGLKPRSSEAEPKDGE